MSSAYIQRNDATSAVAKKAMAVGLEKIGWSLRSVEIDLVSETARIDLKQFTENGERIVTFDARRGRATTTVEIPRVRPIDNGRRSFYTHHDVILLSREHHASAGDGVLWLCQYIADNSRISGQLGADDHVRALFGIAGLLRA